MTIGADFDSKIYGSLYNAFVQHRYHQDFKAESALLVKYIGRGKNKVLSKAPFQKVSKRFQKFPKVSKKNVVILGKNLWKKPPDSLLDLAPEILP